MVAILLATNGGVAGVPPPPSALSIDEASIADLNAAFDRGMLTSVQLVEFCLARIAAYDRKGPVLRGMLMVNPRAIDAARALDAERRRSGRRSALHGIPVVLKDNIDTADMPTTAGSLMLEGSIPRRDAFIVRRLREAGAIVIGKTNMSEFASGPARSSLGGQMKNPHDLDRTPLGSSGGVGISVSSAYAVIGVGTDTGGSIRNPASTTGIVGLKPTLGLISRVGVIPLALTFDTAGPMGRHVSDVAAAMNVLAAVDRNDAATAPSGRHPISDYTTGLKAGALIGARLGLVRDFLGQDPEVDHVVEAAIETMRGLGAIVVDVRLPKWLLDAKGDFYDAVRYPEFAAQVADYLKTLGPGFPKDINELIARAATFTTLRDDGAGPNPARWALLKREAASGGLDDYRYTAVRDHALPMVRAVIEGILKSQQLDALVYPTLPKRAPLIAAPPEPPGGAAGNPVNLANLTGFPDLVVPAGFTAGRLPVTISFLGVAFSEPRLLALGYGFEQATHARRMPVHTPALPGEWIRLSRQ